MRQSSEADTTLRASELDSGLGACAALLGRCRDERRPGANLSALAPTVSIMDLGERLRIRDLLLGEDSRQDELAALLDSEPEDPDLRRVLDDVRPLFTRLYAAVEQHLPFGTPAEAVEYALARSSGFSVEAVAEYCDAAERDGGTPVDQIRGLLAEHVRAGRLTVSYYYDCPGCGNVLDARDDLPDGPFQVFCEHERCRVEHTLDPAQAHAVFRNTNPGPELESWI